jgi:hypothetical protein
MRVKIAANAHLGHLNAARAELSRMLAIDPKLTIAGSRKYTHFAAPELLDLVVTGLRPAGPPGGVGRRAPAILKVCLGSI